VVNDLAARGLGFKVLAAQGAIVDTTSPNGQVALSIFAALAEFEHELKAERIKGMARARGRKDGRPYKLTVAKLRTEMAAMGQRETNVKELCRELGVSRQTLYRHVAPDGSLRADGRKLLEGSRQGT
jgi:DNA invertase Pin-like site-specific DNA recombinase